MARQAKKRFMFPFIIFIGFIALRFTSFYKGFNNQELWRMLAAAIGTFIFLGLTIMLIRVVLRGTDEAADGVDPYQ